MNTTVKNAFCPKAYAACVAGSHDNGNKGDMGVHVKVLTLAAVASSIEKQPQLKEQLVTDHGKDKDNNKAKTLAQFLTDAATASEACGYLSMAMLQDAANLKQLNKTAGTPDFQLLVRRLISKGYIANDQGRTPKDQQDVSVDASELDF